MSGIPIYFYVIDMTVHKTHDVFESLYIVAL